MQKFRLTTELAQAPPPAAAVSLAIPVPPTTANQVVDEMRLPFRWSQRERTALNVAQSAVFVDGVAALPGSSFDVDIVIPQGRAAEEHFVAYTAPSLEPTADAQELYEAHRFAELPEGERLGALLECVARKFRYQHGVNSGLPLTCDLLTGNCLDINAAFVRLLRLAGIRNAYYIGYFFEAGRPLVSDDWHCWVDTISTRGYENWDIAHYLKRSRTIVAPALNPIEGIRFAMSAGRDLRFDCSGFEVVMPHLCEPRWVMQDGRTRKCPVTVTAQPI
jgi:hypothetical protein